MVAQPLVTADQLEQMGREDLELVRGVLVPVMTPAGEQHGALAAFVTVELGAFARANNLGRVYVEVGYRLFTNPDTVRGPDVSFVSRVRAAIQPRRKGFIHGIPDLAVEITSMDKSLADLAVKAAEYLQAGTALVWVVDPESRQVLVYARGAPALTLSAGDVLTGGLVLPGFTLPIGRLFAELE
ncbi:MAG TPA: Uma2 family endonuclease [Gemmatimonadales bacterium]